MMKFQKSSVAAVVALLTSGHYALAENPFRHDPPPANYCPDGLCLPNVKNSGWYPTIWRRWPGLGPINLDKDLPKSNAEDEASKEPTEKKPANDGKEPAVEKPSVDDDLEEFAPTKPKEPTHDEVPGRMEPPTKPPGKETPKTPDQDDIFQNLSPFGDEPANKPPDGANLRRPRLDLGVTTRRKVSEYQGGRVQRIPGRKGVTIITPASAEQAELALNQASQAVEMRREVDSLTEFNPTVEVRHLQVPDADSVPIATEPPTEEAPKLSSRRSAAALRPPVATQRSTATLDDGTIEERPLTRPKTGVQRANFDDPNPLRSTPPIEQGVKQASFHAPESAPLRDGLEQPSTNPLRR
jgi:hypothetical protein